MTDTMIRPVAAGDLITFGGYTGAASYTVEWVRNGRLKFTVDGTDVWDESDVNSKLQSGQWLRTTTTTPTRTGIARVGDRVRLTSVPGWTMVNFERSMEYAGTHIHAVTRLRTGPNGETRLNDSSFSGPEHAGQPTAYFRIPDFADRGNINEFFATYVMGDDAGEDIPDLDEIDSSLNMGDMFLTGAGQLVIVVNTVPDYSGQRMIRAVRPDGTVGNTYEDSVGYMRNSIQSGAWVRVTGEMTGGRMLRALISVVDAKDAELKSARETLIEATNSDARVKIFQTEIFGALSEEAEKQGWCGEYERFLEKHGWETLGARGRDVDVSFVERTRHTVNIRLRGDEEVSAEMVASAYRDQYGHIEEDDIDDIEID